jgi:hypothetical protein
MPTRLWRKITDLQTHGGNFDRTKSPTAHSPELAEIAVLVEDTTEQSIEKPQKTAEVLLGQEGTLLFETASDYRWAVSQNNLL